MDHDTRNRLVAQLIIEAVLCGIFGAILWMQNAPSWAFTMLVLLATRVSKGQLSDAMGHLQQTLRRRDVVMPETPEKKR